MKKFLFLILGLALMAGLAFANGDGESSSASASMSNAVDDAALAYFADYPGARIIKEDAFIEKVKAGESMFIADIRRADDYAKGHVKGAVSIPWGPAIAEQLGSIPQDGAVYVYCYSGQTAGQAIAVMNAAGIPAVSVRYGFVRGISKVDGFQDVITTEAAMTSGSFDVDPALQAAADEYFGNLGAAPFKNNIVSAADAAAISKAGEDVQFVDVRKADAFAAGHIKGAVNIPFGGGMQAGFANLPDKKLIVNCYSGQTAGQVVGILRLLGYDAVSINSGMGTPKTGGKGYASEGFPLEK